MNMSGRAIRAWATPLICALLLAGCGTSDQDAAAARIAATKLEREANANALARNYDQAREAGQYELAQAYANQLLHDAPDTVAAREVQATLADTGVRVDEARDKRRLEKLWSYNVELMEGGGDGVVHSAAIYATRDANNGNAPVRLVLRRHPKWGRSVYLVLDRGEFDCAKGCKVAIKFDDTAAQMFSATKSDINRQAIFIDDEQTIREKLESIRVITIDASVGGKPRTLSFEVGGFDRVQLERHM
jgi:ribosomal protein L12E/L44/L45/RPP1/RPP2